MKLLNEMMVTLVGIYLLFFDIHNLNTDQIQETYN
jgi:hypothetical protein